jgi:hypothetical protein
MKKAKKTVSDIRRNTRRHFSVEDKIRSAREGFKKDWVMKSDKKSPCYTTRINDVMRVF